MIINNSKFKENILVINAGSSSVKFAVFSDGKIVSGIVEKIGRKDSRFVYSIKDEQEYIVEQRFDSHEIAIHKIMNLIEEKICPLSNLSAIGHRVVHGGEFFSHSVLIDQKVIEGIRQCIPLAPLHNPHNLSGILACKKILKIPMVAVFDTAFHQTMPDSAFVYPLPYHYYTNNKIRRYGFHGTSHKYVALEAGKILGKPLNKLKLITLHLGNGCSACAINRGRSVDTSMGFTPLEGLMMGTRAGSIDPAIPLYLERELGMTPDEVDDVLNKESGLLGVSGRGNDMRDLIASETKIDRVRLALSIFTRTIIKHIGAYFAVMGGCDAIVITAGIGENVPQIRAKIVKQLFGFGVSIDDKANNSGKIIISTPSSRIKVMVIPTNEELMIAKETIEVVGHG